MTCKLRRVKRFLRGKIQPESLPTSEMVLALGNSPEKAGQTRRKLLIEDFAVYKQPTTYCKRQLSLPANTRAVIPSEKIFKMGSNMTCFGSQTIEF